MNKKIEIDEMLFWSMYNAIRDAELVLWHCNGQTNPEDEELTESIDETSENLQNILAEVQPIIKKLKENENTRQP